MLSGAVVTGDLVASTKLDKAVLRKLLKELTAILAPHVHEFYRGDSFQVYVKDASAALSLVLRMRTAAIAVLPQAAGVVSDVRASIGIGKVKAPVKLLRTAADEAFVISGRAFDTLKEPQRLTIATPDSVDAVNTGLQLVSEFVDYVFQRMTVKQAAVVRELLQNRTQKETARRLHKSQVTVHKHARAAGWPQLESLLLHYGHLTESLIL